MTHQYSTIHGVVDPVCGMTIAPEDATGQQQYRGATYYFCNPSCQSKFGADPEHYVGGHQPAPPTPGNAGVEYTCPMDPDMPQIGHGTCPKCGMALEPAIVAPAQPRTGYTCPMHPEMVRSEPGSCPICGMAQEPREVQKEDVNPELAGMSRRFRASIALTVPILAFMVSAIFPHDPPGVPSRQPRSHCAVT